MAGNSTDAGRSVTQKITAILMAFTEGSEHSLTEIAHLAALPVSTAHRLTTELVSCHLLIRTADGRYRTGPPLRGMSAGDAQPPDLREQAPCVLKDLHRGHRLPCPPRRVAGAAGGLHREAPRAAPDLHLPPRRDAAR